MDWLHPTLTSLLHQTSSSASPTPVPGLDWFDVIKAGGLFLFTLIYFVRRTEEMQKDQKVEREKWEKKVEAEKEELKSQIKELKEEVKTVRKQHDDDREEYQRTLGPILERVADCMEEFVREARRTHQEQYHHNPPTDPPPPRIGNR